VLAPKGSHIYYADIDTGDYEMGQFKNVQAGLGGFPVGEIPDYAKDFRFEPEL
jgi:hypothetical protein